MHKLNEKLMDYQEPLDPNDLLFVLIGASAVGKSTLAERLCQAGIVEATPTRTTRKPRDGEMETSYDHHFVTDEEFDRLDSEGRFIDQRTFYGARYGLPFPQKPSEGREALMVLKPVFMPALIASYPFTRIYQIEASPSVLPGRMRARGQLQEDIGVRMTHYEAETMAARRFAHVIFNNDGSLEDTFRQVKQQIQADRQAHDSR